MAPRRGGGGSSSGGSDNSISLSCPDAFTGLYSSTDVVYFVSACLFFVLTLIVMISLCFVRKRHGNAKKKLVGPIFLLSLLCMLTSYALQIIGTMLRECGTTAFSTYSYWDIAFNIFGLLGTYLLLVVVVWGINSALRERLGSGQGIVKIASIVILGVIFCLTAGYIGLMSYNIWTTTTDAQDKFHEQNQLSVAYWTLYLLSVVAAGGMSVATLLQTRSRHLPANGLLSWIITVDICMFIWVLVILIEEGSWLQENYLDVKAYEALTYVMNFFQTFSYIAILFLAKSRAWDNTAVANPNPNMYENPSYPQGSVQYAPMPPQQQQYAYNGQPGQQYYYQQQPVYNGTPELANGHRQVAEVK